MAAPAGGGLSPTLQLVRFFPAFGLPTMDPMRFEACFASSVAAEAAIVLISNLDATRDSLQEQLSASEPDVHAIQGTCESYMPHIMNLFDSLNASPSPVAVDRQLRFAWSSPLSQDTRARNAFEVIMFELGQVYATKAFAHMIAAHRLANDSVSPDFARAATELRLAAGIWDYLSERLLPRWVGNEETRTQRPPEAFEKVCGVMCTMCLAMAQQMGVATAVLRGSPKNLVAKLCMGVATLLDQVEPGLRNEAPNHLARMKMDLVTYATFGRTLFRGLAQRFAAEKAAADSEYGIAVGLFDRALATELRVKGKNDATGLDVKAPLTAPLAAHVRAAAEEVGRLRTEADKNNRLITFQRVPDVDDLPEPPQAVVMMKAEAHTPPTAPTPVPFVTLADRQAAKAPAPAPAPASAPSAPAAEGKTDEELARELQAKFDAGLDS